MSALLRCLFAAFTLLAFAVTPLKAQDAIPDFANAPERLLDGELSVVHIDYEDPSRDTTVYHLLTNEGGQFEAWELIFERGAPRGLVTGQRVSIRGRAHGLRMLVDDISSPLQPAPNEESSDGHDHNHDTTSESVAGATQERSWIAVLINITGTETWNSGHVTTAENVMLHNTRAVDRIYREASFDGVGFATDATNGRVVGPITLDKIDTCPYYSYANAADAAVSSIYGINTRSYTHTLYIIPQGAVSDCNWLGLGQIGSYSSTSNRLSWNTRLDESLIAHEVGHNYGWHHAATDGNNDGYDPSQSTDSEYADTSDTMGYCCTEKKFNAVHLDQAGWFDNLPSGSMVTVLSDGNFTLAPLGSDPNVTTDPQILLIDKPDSNESYYISYRQRIGVDDLLSSSYLTGISIHHGRRPGNWSYLIDVLNDGEIFQDAVNGITIVQNSHGASGVNIDISFDNCLLRNPLVGLSPSTATSYDGSASFSGTVTNEDTLGCSYDSFLVSGNYGGLASPDSLILDPSTSGNSNLSYSGLADGNYTITMTAARGTNAGSASASLTVDATAPTAPLNPTTSTRKVKGQRSVVINWTAPSDVIGIDYYVISGGGIAGSEVVTGTRYTDSNADTNAAQSYSIVAVDNAGRTGDAATATYSPGTDDGGGGGGGNGGGRGKKNR